MAGDYPLQKALRDGHLIKLHHGELHAKVTDKLHVPLVCLEEEEGDIVDGDFLDHKLLAAANE